MYDFVRLTKFPSRIVIENSAVYGTTEFNSSVVEQYVQDLTSSRFCLVARGITLWTRRLFEAILGGCIPVLVNDDLVLPFEQQLDYLDFVVRIPEAESKTLLPTLVGMSNREISRRCDAMRAVRSAFSYDASQGKALEHILRELARKSSYLTGEDFVF